MTDMYRPRKATEIIDASVQLFRRHALTFFGIGAAVQVPLLLLHTILLRAFGATPDGTPNSLAVQGVLSVVDGLAFVLGTAALTAAASRGYMGESPRARQSLAEGVSKFGPFFVASLLSGLAMVFGVVLLVVGAFYFFAKFTLAATAALVEGRSGTDALGRASKLSEGKKLHVLTAVGAAWLMFLAIVIGAGALSTIVPSVIALVILSTIANVFAFPLVPIVTVITYYDLRIRAEGYDIELLERHAGASHPAPASAAG